MDILNYTGHNSEAEHQHVEAQMVQEAVRKMGEFSPSIGMPAPVSYIPEGHNRKGLFIVFEGGEGSGKTTQARMLAEALDELEIPNCLTKEPGDTALGKELRTILLDRDREPFSRKAEALLFAADRAEHVEKVIVPALDRGEVVICDRYIASTMAYQAYTGDLDPHRVSYMSDWASGGVHADATYFLDVDPAIGLERAMRDGRTRFEDKSVAYHEKVRRGFLRQIDSSWLVVDSHRTIEDVHETILAHLGKFHGDKINHAPGQRCVECLAKLTTPAPIARYRCPMCGGVLMMDNACQDGHGRMVLNNLGDHFFLVADEDVA